MAAPRHRAFAIGILFAVAGPAALADEPISTDAVYACAALEDDTERLDCYDGAVGRLQAAEEAGEITTVSRQEIEQVEREGFGFSLPSLPRLAMPSLGGGDSNEDRLQEISAGVIEIREGANGRLLIMLDGGQVWRQTDDTRITNFYRRAETAEVKRGALGSFWMTLGDSRRFRAERVS